MAAVLRLTTGTCSPLISVKADVNSPTAVAWSHSRTDRNRNAFQCGSSLPVLTLSRSRPQRPAKVFPAKAGSKEKAAPSNCLSYAVTSYGTMTICWIRSAIGWISLVCNCGTLSVI